MIISHSQRIVLLKPPRSGTTTAHMMLADSGLLRSYDQWTTCFLHPEEILDQTNKMPGLSLGDIEKADFYKTKILSHPLPGGSHPFLAHLNPTEARRLDVLMDFAIENYLFIVPVRHPIERAISCWFFSRFQRGVPIDPKRMLANCAKMIMELPRGTDLLTKWYTERRSSDYVHVEGKPIKNLWLVQTEDLDSCLYNFIKDRGGIPSTKKLQSSSSNQKYMDWKSWMPDDLVEQFEEEFAEDFALYNSAKLPDLTTDLTTEKFL